MSRLFAVVLIVLGAALCAWSVIAAAMSPEGIDGLQLTPRSSLGLGWLLVGIVGLFIGPRSLRRGPGQR
jgi:hypothetical protein